MNAVARSLVRSDKDASARNEILNRIWPIREPLNEKSVTVAEWEILGGDPQFPLLGNSDMLLTLLERAAAERLEETFAGQPHVDFR